MQEVGGLYGLQADKTIGTFYSLVRDEIIYRNRIIFTFHRFFSFKKVKIPLRRYEFFFFKYGWVKKLECSVLLVQFSPFYKQSIFSVQARELFADLLYSDEAALSPNF